LLFESDNLRRRISKYYLKSETIISTLEYLQSKKDQITNKNNELLRDVKLKNPSFNETEINESIKDLMKTELVELNLINQNIPRLVNKLDWIINEAQNIIDQMERI
jgi:hypothetical protein